MSVTFSDENREIEIHNYHELTSEYLSTDVMLIEANTGLPALCTVEPLPFCGQNEVAVFKEDKWVALEDNRGQIWDIRTKEITEFTELGLVPDGKTKLKPEAFDIWDGFKWVLDTVAQLKGAQLAASEKVREFSTQCRKSIAGSPDHLETAEWSEKRLRSVRIKNNEASPSDIEKIETEALYREQGESVDQLATKILAKSERFEHASIVITGMAAAAIKAVNDAKNVNEIDQLLTSLESNARIKLAQL